MATDLDLLRDLCAAPAPTGFEAPVQDLVRRRLAAIAEPQGDPLGNVWATVAGRARPTSSSPLTPTRSASSSPTWTSTASSRSTRSAASTRSSSPAATSSSTPPTARCNGVVGRRPSHKMSKDERAKAPGPQRPVARPRRASRDEALALVQIGDPITFPAQLPAARRRALRLAGLRQPRRRVRVPARARALRRRAGGDADLTALPRCTRRRRSWAPRRWRSAGSRT